MSEYKFCSSIDMAISILEFIKQKYEENNEQAGVHKYIEALQIAIEALKFSNNSTPDKEITSECQHCWDHIGIDTYRCNKCGFIKEDI
jgi:hypothetical protein